ncbi:hypothetical protein D3C84_837240 [compost metagenome]
MQFPGTLVLRVQFENLLDLTVGTVDVTATQVATGQFEFFIEAAHVVELAHCILGTPVVRLDGQHPVVADARGGEVPVRTVGVSLGQQRGNRLGVGGVAGQVQFGITRVFPQPFFNTRQAGLVLPLLDQLGRFLVGDLGRTARHQPGTRTAKAHQQTGSIHGVLPIDKVWDKCKGR